MNRPLRTVHRRELLHVLGLSAVAAVGCFPRGRNLASERGRPGRRRDLVPVDARPGRHVRSTVGLRPFRNHGFRLDAERLDDKQLIHNYGHGGGGITLSWGTANLAVNMIEGLSPPGPVAVIGAGVIGLTTAILLQRIGYDVTIHAAAAWPHTTSNASAATFFPSHVIAPEHATPLFAKTLESALSRSWHAFQRLTGARYGIKWLDSYSLVDPAEPRPESPREIESEVFARVVPSARELLGPGQHPFGVAQVARGLDLVIEPMTYLRALLDEVRMAGGQVRIRRFDSLRDVATLPARVIFNCTGLGARTLLGDTDVRPARGQLCVLPPQPDVTYTLYHGPFYYMVPREDGIILGGTFELDNAATRPDADTDRRILAAHRAVFDHMR